MVFRPFIAFHIGTLDYYFGVSVSVFYHLLPRLILHHALISLYSNDVIVILMK
jgi:hypothetical protein